MNIGYNVRTTTAGMLFLYTAKLGLLVIHDDCQCMYEQVRLLTVCDGKK